MTLALRHPFQQLLLVSMAAAVALCCLFLFAPRAQASQLTEPQIQALEGLLAAFNVDETTIATVDAILRAPAAEVLGASIAAGAPPAILNMNGFAGLPGALEQGAGVEQTDVAQTGPGSAAASAPAPSAPASQVSNTNIKTIGLKASVTVTTTQPGFITILKTFTLPQDANFRGLSGSISLTSKIPTEFSEALISLITFPAVNCPKDGEKYNSPEELNAKYAGVKRTNLQAYILKLSGQSTVSMPIDYTLPVGTPVPPCIVVAFGAGFPDKSGDVVTDSNLLFRYDTGGTPDLPASNISLGDEFCFGLGWGCQLATQSVGSTVAFRHVEPIKNQSNLLALVGNVSDAALIGSMFISPSGSWSTDNDYYVYHHCTLESGRTGPSDYYAQIPSDAVHLLGIHMNGNGKEALQQPVYKAFDNTALYPGDCLVHLVRMQGGNANGTKDQGQVDAENQMRAIVSPIPALSIKVAPSSIISGGSVTLAWSAQNVDSCQVLNGSVIFATGVKGSKSTGPLTADTTYKLLCTNGNSAPVSASYIPPAVGGAPTSAASGNNALVAHATVDVTGAPDKIKPTVTFTAPKNNQRISGSVYISANAEDRQSPKGQTTSGISSVSFAISGKSVVTLTEAPYAYVWHTESVATGTYPVSVTALDKAGNATAATVNVSVSHVQAASTPLVRLNRYYYSFPELGDHMDLPLESKPASIGEPYKKEGGLGYISTIPGPGLQPLYSCLFVYNTDYDIKEVMTSRQKNCEGQQYLGLLGYVWTNPGNSNDFAPLYRCLRSNNVDYYYGVVTITFVDHYSYVGDNPCKGGGHQEGIMGYVSKKSAIVPSLSLSASPTGVEVGKSAVITWSAQNASSCQVSQGSAPFAEGISGTKSTGNLNRDTTYRLTCSSTSGSKVATTTIVAVRSVTPAVTLTATPASVGSGQSATLAWKATNVASCTGTGFTAAGTSGSVTVKPAQTTTYSISCSTPGVANVTASATVTVTPATDPKVTLSGIVWYDAKSNGIIDAGESGLSGQTVQLQNSQTSALLQKVTTNASGAYSFSVVPGSYRVGIIMPSGYQRTTDNSLVITVTAATNTRNFGIQKISPPTVTLTASPASIGSGQSSTLTWKATNTSSCTSSGFSAGSALSGSVTVKPAVTTTYSISCSTPGVAPVTAHATVTVTAGRVSTLDPAALAASVVMAPFSLAVDSLTDIFVLLGVGQPQSAAVANASPALSFSVDPGSPSYALAAGGSTGVVLGRYKVHASGDSISLLKLEFKLDSGAPSDVAQVYLYKGPTLVGTAVFTNSAITTVVLTAPVTIAANSDVTLQLQADLAPIGMSKPGKAGDLVTVNTSYYSAVSSGGVTLSGSAASSNGGVAGVRMYRSVPRITISARTLCVGPGPCRGVGMTLGRFEIAADPAGSIGVRTISALVVAQSAEIDNAKLYAYSDPNHLNPIGGFSGQVGNSCDRPDKISCAFVASPVLEIPAGMTYYFMLRGTVIPASATAWSASMVLLGDPSLRILSTPNATDYFSWSPNDSTTSGVNDSDWTNGFALPNLQVMPTIPASITVLYPAQGSIFSTTTIPFSWSWKGIDAASAVPVMRLLDADGNEKYGMLGKEGGLSFTDAGGSGVLPPPANLVIPTGKAAYKIQICSALNNGLCVVGAPFYIVKAAVPSTPEFSVSPKTGQAPLAVSFSASGLNTTGTYRIDFGDGSTQTLHPECQSGGGCSFPHTYTKAGTYQAALSYSPTCVAGTICSALLQLVGKVTITVTGGNTSNAPTLTLTASPASILSGQSSTISWSSKDAASCSSTGSDLSAPIGLTGSVTVAPLKSAVYTLTCAGSAGSAGSVTKSVTINVSAPPPPANATISGKVWNDSNGNRTIDSGEATLSGQTVQLLNSTTGAVLKSVTTNSSGAYSINTAPGSYRLQIVMPSGYQRTTDNSFIANFLSGSNTRNFGIQKKPSVTDSGLPGTDLLAAAVMAPFDTVVDSLADLFILVGVVR